MPPQSEENILTTQTLPSYILKKNSKCCICIKSCERKVRKPNTIRLHIPSLL